MEAFQRPRRASQAAYVFTYRLALVGTIVLRSINIPGFIWGCGGEGQGRDRGNHVQRLPLAGCLVPTVRDHACSLWTQPPPALTTLRGIAQAAKLTFCLSTQMLFPAAALRKQQNCPGSSKPLASVLFLQPVLVARTCLFSSSSFLRLPLPGMVSPKVPLQQVSRPFPVSILHH